MRACVRTCVFVRYYDGTALLKTYLFKTYYSIINKAFGG